MKRATSQKGNAPTAPKPKTKRINVWVKKEIKAIISREARLLGISRAELIRRAVREKLDNPRQSDAAPS